MPLIDYRQESVASWNRDDQKLVQDQALRIDQHSLHRQSHCRSRSYHHWNSRSDADWIQPPLAAEHCGMKAELPALAVPTDPQREQSRFHNMRPTLESLSLSVRLAEQQDERGFLIRRHLCGREERNNDDDITFVLETLDLHEAGKIPFTPFEFIPSHHPLPTSWSVTVNTSPAV